MKIRFPFTPASDLNSTSGPSVLVAAYTQAMLRDSRFADMNQPWAADDIPLFPVMSARLLNCVREGRRVAIGPNVLYGLSYSPGMDENERLLMGYTNYAAIFSLSRWYVELLRQTMKQTTGYHLIDYPLPALPGITTGAPARPAFVYIKGGAVEQAIALEIQARIPGAELVHYGSYRRADMLKMSCESSACYYVSHEDHYPLAAVEIGAMGCPIISDEKSCPVVAHGLTGLLVPVRERDTRAGFAWASDTAARLVSQQTAAAGMDRDMVRDATWHKHSPARFCERIVAATGT